MCLWSRRMRNKRYEKNKKNGGIIPAVSDTRALWVNTKCGKCSECLSAKARDWIVRLNEDIRYNRNGVFVTLTFSNEEITKLYKVHENYRGYEKDNKVAKYAVRHFYERWRKEFKKSIRHWLVTELGHKGTENLHLHGILWCDNWKDIARKWNYGFVWDGYNEMGKRINYVNEQTINYMTKYVSKQDEKHPNYVSQVIASPGIGRDYTTSTRASKNRFNEIETEETYRTRSGIELPLPTYFRNKIYSDEEREKLWMQKLDQKFRWVHGEKVWSEEERMAAIEWHRLRDIELGYGNYNIDHEQVKWENEQREIMISKRMGEEYIPYTGWKREDYNNNNK